MKLETNSTYIYLFFQIWFMFMKRLERKDAVKVKNVLLRSKQSCKLCT